MMVRQRVIVALMIGVAATAAAAVDAGAPVAISQALRPFGDDFNGRIFWYSDDYSGIDVFPRTERVSNVGATLEPGESAPCGSTGATLWFEWQADRDGTLVLSTEGSSIATVLAVYVFDWSGSILPSPPGAQLRTLACDTGTSGVDAEASLELPVQRYNSYLIQAGGLSGAQGEIVLHANCECGPPNDSLGYDVGYLYVDPYTPEARRAVNTTRATVEAGEDTSCGNMGATVWWTTSGATSPRVDFSVANSDFPAAVAVYAADYNDPTPYPPGGTLRRVGCSSDGSTLTLALDQSQEYWVQAGGIDGARGNLVLEMRCNPACPPYNDNAGSAEWLEPPASYGANTASATNESGEPAPCGGIENTVWYLVIARGNTRITIDTEFSEFSTAIAVYEVEGVSPPGGEFDLITCDSADTASGFAEIEFDAKANIGYYLQIGGVDGASGTFALNVDCDPSPCPPYNDSIRQPSWFGPPSSEPYVIAQGVQTQNASVEPGESTACGNMGRTTWYALDYYADAPPRPLRITTDGSDYDTAVAVYESSIDVYTPEFSDLTPVACAQGGTGIRASAAFTGLTRMWVQIGGRNGAGGTLTVSVACDPYCPPANDDSSNAWSFYGNAEYDIDVRGATIEEGEPGACGPASHTVWFRADASAMPLNWTFDASASDYEPIMAVYAMDGVSPPGGLAEALTCAHLTLEFTSQPNVTYLIQVADRAGSGGRLRAVVSCEGECATAGGGQGGGGGPSGASVTPPDTGSGGYLRAASPN